MLGKQPSLPLVLCFQLLWGLVAVQLWPRLGGWGGVCEIVYSIRLCTVVGCWLRRSLEILPTIGCGLILHALQTPWSAPWPESSAWRRDCCSWRLSPQSTTLWGKGDGLERSINDCWRSRLCPVSQLATADNGPPQPICLCSFMAT